MVGWADVGLSPAQATFVEEHLPGARVVRDLSWGLFDNHVAEVRAGGDAFVVKAGGPDNHHIRREIGAHESWTQALVAEGLTSRMVAADRDRNVLVLEYLPGGLVEGAPAEHDPETWEQAGRLLRAFHAQHAERSDDHEARETAKSLRALEAEHRIDPASVAEARSVLERSEPRPVVLVPTHGAWQPRNWLIDHGVVRVIDFGRFGFRPASSDLIRVDSKQWPEHPDLAAAFFDGYGPDPREPDLWPVVRLREAIGTAVWAYEVGDDRFEEHGHRMLAAALRAFR
jgi:hypothetical protein